MERTRPPQQLTADETHQILKRAAQLEIGKDGQAADPSLDLAEVERIGIEAGLSRDSIRRAFAELRAGELAAPASPSLGDRLLGPAIVESRTFVADAPEIARRRLHELLRGELLHPEERKGSRTVWTRTPGLWAALQRGLNWQGQSAWQKGTTLTTEVLPAPPGLDANTSVHLTVEREDRARQLVGMFVPGGALGAVALGLAFTPDAPGIVAGVIGGIAALTTAIVVPSVRGQYRRRMRELKLAVERVLEQLGGSGPPDAP
ncbi:MAG TPA: hypothetical protein VFL36_00400 [Myxococcales bacterium]|nr:hypothetical protein [Myxococcales bacterium]